MRTRRAVLGLIAAAPASVAWAVSARDAGEALAAAARRQVGITRGYDSGYHRLAYPGGDVPRSTGVCADVVVRAARDAWGVDLQRRVHEDMARAFGAYPRKWGLAAPDANIDHRRVPNLETFWTWAGARLWHAQHWTAGFAFPGPLQAGDILTWRTFFSGGPHVGVVVEAGAWPRIVHNAGFGTHEELLAEQLLNSATAHFRWRPAPA